MFSTLFLAFLVPARRFGFLADDDFLVCRLFVFVVFLLVLAGFLLCVFLVAVLLVFFLVDRLALVVFLFAGLLVERRVFVFFFVDALRLLIGFLVFFVVFRLEITTKKSTHCRIKNSQITCF